MDAIVITVLPLLLGWILDLVAGDPPGLPHLIVGFGRLIAVGEKALNRGSHRILLGAVLAIGLIMFVSLSAWLAIQFLSRWPVVAIAFQTVLIYYCLAGTTLRREVRMVFRAADESLDSGRKQVARIVGRDTASLSDREVRTAALETLAENLNDGVVAPLFWYAFLGVPGMVGYKMINTLDSMIGYRNDRYILFGKVAARIDDVAGYIPARLTAIIMIIVSGHPSLLRFVLKFGPCHASPNSGYPEAALAGILDCRFGGTHDYFGKPVVKPYIGTNERALTTADMNRAMRINVMSECLMMAIAGAVRCVL